MACAEAILAILLHYNLPVWKREALPELICQPSEYYKVDPILVTAVIKAETEFHHFKRPNRTHDYGIMQIHCPNRKYAPWCKNKKKLLSLAGNIKIGVWLLSKKKEKCRQFKHRGHHWVKHYNWRSKTWTRRVLRNYRKMKRLAANL